MTMYKHIIVDTLNSIQNNQYMGMLDKKEMVTRDKWRDFGVDIYNFMEDLKNLGAINILILGPEGSGKSYGVKGLEPSITKWFHADNKPLTFKGANQAYLNPDGSPKDNFVVPKTYGEITKWIEGAKKVGIVAKPFYVFLLAHVEEYKSGDINADTRQRMKVLGSLATKMNIEGSVSHCYYTDVLHMGSMTQYKLRVQNTGKNTGRSPEQMFDEILIDNNFGKIVDAIEKY